MLFCDLDGFKPVNDRSGHEGGDQVLVEVAHRLRRAVRDGDIVARLGGDEFVVLCERVGDTTDVAERVAERLHELVEDPITHRGERFDVGPLDRDRLRAAGGAHRRRRAPPPVGPGDVRRQGPRSRAHHAAARWMTAREPSRRRLAPPALGHARPPPRRSSCGACPRSPSSRSRASTASAWPATGSGSAPPIVTVRVPGYRRAAHRCGILRVLAARRAHVHGRPRPVLLRGADDQRRQRHDHRRAPAGPRARGGRPAVRRAGAAQPRSLWGAVAVAGTAIVVLGGDGGGANSLRGDLLAVGALVAWTAYFVCTKSARQHLDRVRVPHRHGDRGRRRWWCRCR